jgi:carbamoyltransferase
LYILGINAYHGDASAALVKDGQLIAAVEEERFSRIKHCAGFPGRAVEYCLRAANIAIEDLDHVAISRNPSAHLHKKVVSSLGRLSKSPTAIPGNVALLAGRLMLAAKARDLKEDLAKALGVTKSNFRAAFHNVEHHQAHMASCFLVSEFDKAAILSIDGFGDFVSTMWGFGDKNHIDVFGRVEYPHSTGILYTAVTQYLGFPHYGDEGKVMGLAPYGKPSFMDEFRDIIRTEKNGQFRLNLDYFRHHSEGFDMTWDEGSPKIGRVFSDKFIEIFGSTRDRQAPLDRKHEDIAASLQLRLEEVSTYVLQHLYERTHVTNLCVAGGVAFNSVMNGKILLNTPFQHIYIQPAAGDSGTAVGAAFHVWNVKLKQDREFVMNHAYTGPWYSDEEIENSLKGNSLQYTKLSDSELTKQAATIISEGKIVGWFQGRTEFGPRALGNRSIVVDPRRPDMKDILNSRIKKRESFRPFAPSILEEKIGEYFEQTHPAPTMLMVYQIREEKRPRIPAVTHVDGSGRLQTVSRETNPRYYQLIRDFEALTGVPIVLNTSFNEDEPIVCSPEDAIRCFTKTRMDALFLGNYMVTQPD